MKKTLHALVCLFIMGIMGNPVAASPAYPNPVKVTQPDGTTVTVILKGDEFAKWAQTLDGYTLLYNSRGVYEYAVVNTDGDIVPSGVRASEQSHRTAAETALLTSTAKGLSFSRSQLDMIRSIQQIRDRENSLRTFPTTGARKLVCILMGFKDKAFTKTQADMNNLFNQVGYSANGATGSVKDFYNENSWNQFNLTVTVAGPFTAANNMSYYGGNDASGSDSNPRALVTEAVNAADATVNFADFDNDNDGTVDGVYVIYAGYGEEAGGGADCIWAHAWNITSVTKDGKTISKYSCSAELSGNSGSTICAIGVICHEFGHVLGAPDYYDTNYSTGGQFDGTGYWDIMSAGSWNNNGITPAHHNAYTKVKVYGWATATELTSATNVSVSNAEANKSFYQINSTTSGEYWLMENRQQVGFDANIPGHGLIIYHVNSGIASATTSNNINATYPQKMYPVCASATTNPGTTASTYGTINGGGCSFPGTSSKTSFTDATTPNMKSWAGTNTAKPISSIVENTSTKTITFSFMGGVSTPTAPAAITVAASGTSTSGATLNGTVNANNATTTVTFEYGTTTSYGSSVNGSPSSVTGSAATSVSVALTGLAANTTYNFRVKAVNSVGTTYGSNMTFTTSANPTALSLPVTENFATSSLPTGWTTQNVGTGITERWSLSNTANAGGVAYELKCSYQNLNPGPTRVITPAINTVGASQLALSFKHMLDDYASGATLSIQTSTDKVTWTNETWSLATASNSNVGPVTVNTTITHNLNSATTYIAFVVVGNLYQFDYWYIDNVSISAGTSSTTPTVSTSAISSITSSTAVSGGNVTADGGATVTERGVCYGTSQNPTLSNSKVISGSGTGSFTANLSNLVASTTYYVRAYAINTNGTVYGTQQSFTTLAGSLTYCASKGSNVAYEWIDLVQFAGINKSSTADAGYKDNTSLVGNVSLNSTVPIYLSAGFKSSAYTEFWTVWIDFDHNGTFDTSELVASGSSSSSATLTYNVTIPAAALLGNTRMRVTMKYNAVPTACETFSYGEVEDYTVNISQSSGAPVFNNPFAIALGNEVPTSLTVFPNPALDHVTVQLNGVDSEVMLRVYDMRGALVKIMPMTERNIDVDISNLPKGVYIISVDDEKQPITKQFVKQ